MSHKFILIVAATIFAGISASGQTGGQPATNTGPFGGTIVTTPTATLPTPVPAAGISDAGRAGISATAPNNTGLESNLGNSTAAYANGAPVNPSGMNVSKASTPDQAINDMGPSFYSDTLAGSANTVSVAEVSAQFKAAKAGVNTRTLSNDDVQKMLSNKTGVTMAKNMPPLGPGAAPQSAASQPSSAQVGAAAQSTAETAQSSAPAGQQTQPAAAGQRAGT